MRQLYYKEHLKYYSTNFRTEKSTQVAITIVWVSVGVICIPSLLLHETIPFPSISDVTKVFLLLLSFSPQFSQIWDEGLDLTNPTAPSLNILKIDLNFF